MKNKTNKKQVRQGDVLVVDVDSIPKTAKKIAPEDGRIILAHGEATGHHHSVDIKDADWWKDGDNQFMTVKTATPIRHQEHNLAPLSPGKKRLKEKRRIKKQILRLLDTLSVGDMVDDLAETLDVQSNFMRLKFPVTK